MSFSALFGRLTAIALVFVVSSGFSPLAFYNAFVPKDAGVERFADIAYGQGARNDLDIYRPEERGAPLPVVFFIYGGGWNSGDKDNYVFAGRALAAQGYVTVIADYRLVPEVRFPAFLEDGAAALAWIESNIARFGGDLDRFALVGHSAGAYNAVMLALDSSYLEAAGFSGEIDAVAGLSGPYDFLPLDERETIAAFGQTDDLATTQPINYTRGDAPPMLLINGAEDTLVYPRNAATLSQLLTQAGASATLGIYPELDHAGPLLALSRWYRGESTVFPDLIAFLRTHL